MSACSCRAQLVSNVTMLPLSVVVCSALLALAAATKVEQCPGKTFEDLSDHVQLTPCKKVPCKLRKGTNQHISIAFIPEADIDDVKNSVVATVFGVPLPFIGVDGNSICDKLQDESGTSVSCPLKAGTKYVYKDSFPVLSIYPNIDTKIQWALKQEKKDIICFEVAAKII